MSALRTAALLLGFAGTLGAQEEPRRPNLLFVFSDDHATAAISAYGSNRNVTPNLDRLAAEGMLFENAFCGNSICAPSRATILTGLHSHANGHLDNSTVFDGSQTTFPKLLQGAGYQTAIVGKWHLRSDPTGFDHWEVLIGQGPYYNPPLKSAAGTRRVEGYTTEVITDVALEWLGSTRDPERPFLLMVQHKAPHRNWQPGPAELELVGATEFPEPATLFDDGAGRAGAFHVQAMTIAAHLNPNDLKLNEARGLTDEQRAAWDAAYARRRAEREDPALAGDDLVRWKYQQYMQDYMACITGLDRQVGRVLDAVDELGLADDTIVAYSSDQGFYLGEHGWYDKRWMYEESLRMPLIVRWPGVTAPASRDAHMVQNIDYAPTFLDLAGVAVPATMHGRSLAPLLRGEAPDDWRDSIYYHYYEFPGPHSVPRHYGVRTERHKLVRYYRRGEVELFDLARDPHELASVHDDPAYAATRTALERELRRLQREFGEEDPEGTVERVRAEALRRRAAAVPRREVFCLYGFDAAPPEAAPKVAGRPFAVVARVVSPGEDGVVAAQGGENEGWCLEVTDGRAAFVVRTGGRAYEVLGPRVSRVGVVHLVGRLDVEGRLTLFVDGQRVAWAAGSLIAAEPAEGLSLERDADSSVSPRAGERPGGALLELRFLEGPVSDDWIRESAER